MDNYDVQVILHNANGLPEDSYVNTLHFEVNAPDTLEELADGLNAAYEMIDVRLAQAIHGMTVKIYTPGPNLAGPVFQKAYTTPVGGSGNGPFEVAICLSYATVDNPLASTKRRRGRIFVGPLASGVVGTERPGSTIQNPILDFGEALASIGTAGNTTWLMYSPSDDVYVKIESIWVDDAWDTQRRRGLKPTSRLSRDVQ